MFQTKRPTIPAAEEILGGYFPVLDHGFASLVDYLGGDEAIERSARTSYGFGTRQTSATRGLLRYLRRHDHTSPTEFTELVFHLAMPMFVARQWIRHRTASVNEYSGRYSLMPLVFYTPEDAQIAVQSTTNKQGRDGLADWEVRAGAVGGWEWSRNNVAQHYEWLTAEGVARELARIDLPLSTYTFFYWKIDLHNLLHFLRLRCDSHAQYEIRAYADVIAGMVKQATPVSFEAWIDYTFAAKKFSFQELRMLQHLVQVSDNGKIVEPHGTGVSHLYAKTLGVSTREWEEFVAKLTRQERPDFNLDLTQMRNAAYFEERIAAAVPKGDQ